MEELMKETKAGQTVPTSETEPKKKFGLPKSKKAKKWMKIAIAAVVIAAVAAGCMARASKKANAYLGGSYLVAPLYSSAASDVYKRQLITSPL